MSIRTFAARCAHAFGVPARLVPLPTAMIAVLSTASRVLPLPLFPDQLARLRVAKEIPGPEAEHDLGFRPRLLEEGLPAATPPAPSRT
jgi:hypothetical protein